MEGLFLDDRARDMIAADSAEKEPLSVVRPARQTAPLVISSPHSGQYYPDEFKRLTRLDPVTLRRSEDSFTDELFAAGPEYGIPLIAATFARAYVDCNREAFELDPTMFADPLPDYVNRRSVGVRTGFGTIARRVTPELEIYTSKISFEEAQRRIAAIHRPYHQALEAVMENTRAIFGSAFLIDIHSMPPLPAAGQGRINIVLGDLYGTSADPGFITEAETVLKKLGYRVGRNVPYAGGYITKRYGMPKTGWHAIQIEIDRSLYMDQARMEKNAGFASVAANMATLVTRLGEWTKAFHKG